MAEIRCPNCGKINPDFFDNCQFCQTPLKSDSTLHMGEKPTKKNTGELENVLPDWLKDVRKQARDSAEEDAIQTAKSSSPKDEPPDLLAGLAFQTADSEEEDVPDWLTNLSSTGKQERSIPSTPAEPENDFFAQFNKSESAEAPKPPTSEETPSWMSGQPQDSGGRDELSEWFSKAAGEPSEPLSAEPDLSQIDSGWGGSTNIPSMPEPSAPKEEEDLSWLHNLEDEAKKTGELSSPKQGGDWFAEFSTPSTPTQSSGQDDLSWLNNLGGLAASEPVAPESSGSKDDLSWLKDFDSAPAVEQPAEPPSKPKEDLSWLHDLGSTPASEQLVQPPSAPKEGLSWLDNFASTPAPSDAQSLEPKEDLSWLNTLGATPEVPSQPTSQPQEDLGWLNNLGAAPEQPSQPASEHHGDLSWLNAFSENPPSSQPASTPPASEEDLGWLSHLQSSSEPFSSTPSAEPPLETDQPGSVEEPADVPHVSPFTPRRTAPLTPAEDASIPDWLKSATEGPSMPINADQLNQFRGDLNIPASDEPFSWKNFVPEAKQDEEPAPPAPKKAFVDSSPFGPVEEALSNKDVDSLFSVDMPDWLSQPAPEEAPKPSQEIGIHAEGGEALAPVDLPSWVQAMRPVEAVIAETAAVEDQPTEREGPLAGFKGIIPVVPIGSSRRPQPIPLKLQVTDEQQASAAIMEQILASETSPRTLLSTPTVASQRALRQVIFIVMIVLLSIVIFMRTQFMQVSATLPAEVDAAARTLEIVPENSSVLVVVDYEPSLAGELEATSGPLLNHLALLRHPRLSFISTSPNGVGLVDRLVRNTSITDAAGNKYTEGQNYFNLGYLPGGESGILAFIRAPQAVSQFADPGGFSQYSAVILLTDHADSARSWIEQLSTSKQADPSIVNQPLLVVSSAQAGPMLQPYVSSRQVNGMVNGLSDAARYEHKNNVPPGTARLYWDAFGIGVILAIALIVLGSLWSLFARMRANRVEAGEA